MLYRKKSFYWKWFQIFSSWIIKSKSCWNIVYDDNKYHNDDNNDNKYDNKYDDDDNKYHNDDNIDHDDNNDTVDEWLH